MRALPSPSDLIRHRLERAWYLLTLLLRLGRPAKADELDCDLDLVESLCQIRGSPLCMSDDGFVTVSESAIGCFCRFWSCLVASSVLRCEARVNQNWNGLVYTMKRKERDFEGSMPASRVRRRLLIGFESVEKEESEKEKCIQLVSICGSEYENSTNEVQFHVNPEILQNFFQSNPLTFPIRELPIHMCKHIFEGEKKYESLQLEKFIQPEIDEEIPIQIIFGNELVPSFKLEALPNSNLPVSPVKMDQNENLDEKDNETNEMGEFKAELYLIKEKEAEIGTGDVQLEPNGEEGEQSRVVKSIFKKKNERKIDAMKKIFPNEVNNPHGENGSKSQVKPKQMPKLKSFTIEEEEGSGGYGTVYKARRKSDGKIFAVKCPHKNANSHHVNNEIKMLHRFGGKNGVIKYEESFKYGDSECLVLQHFEHDRPEVLKKEMTVTELRWYGHCLFSALSSLHKQGVVHRDVKPGNFLYSRKLTMGYLIDFNLATDLHQRFLRNETSKDPFSLSTSVPSSSNSQKGNQIPTSKRKRSTSNSHRVLDSLPDLLPKIESKKRHKNLTSADVSPMTSAKDHTSARNSLEGRISILSRSAWKDVSVQAFTRKDALVPERKRIKRVLENADISGVTSAKDQTSTRNSQERRNEPILYHRQIRKESTNFLNNSTRSPNNKDVSVPAPVQASVPATQRKRVAAPQSKVDRNHLIFTPMPLYSNGVAVAGSSAFKSKDGKHKKEGPCVGTKGFRAPEVLFKSSLQSCKIDMWSAGVTLLYLIIGKSPFAGDPEQNAKEIAKLRGSEDLWEVAKLHNCESSFPSDLCDVRYLPAADLKEWCRANTRRPEFFESIPDSLLDLVDKCLTVNPRKRISSEEAICHEFLSPCLADLERGNLFRKKMQTGNELRGIHGSLAPLPTESTSFSVGSGPVSYKFGLI